MKKTITKTLLGLTLAACAAVSAVAEDEIIELERFVVTGDPLQSSSSELPNSASFFGANTMDQAGTAHLADLISSVPNLNFAGGTSRPRFFMIRGIGENSQFDREVPATSVGFILDGIDFTGLGSGVSLFDLEQVEVLRGPQSTAYGATALAGLIVARSRAPSENFQGYVEAGVGDDSLRTVGVAAGGPIIASTPGLLTYRISVQRHQQDGFRDNVFVNRSDTNRRDEDTVRLRLRMQATRQLTLEATLLYLDFDNGYDVWSLDNNSFITRTDEPGRDLLRAKGLGLKAEWQFSERLALHYSGGLQHSDTDYRFDWDWSNEADLIAAYGPEVYGGIDAMERDRRVTNHDLRLLGMDNAGDFIQWVTGIYLRDFKEKQDYFGDLSRYDTRNIALYALGRIPFSEILKLSIGGRLERSEVDLRDTGGMYLNGNDTLWGVNTALEWDVAAGHLAYLSLARGFKAGGFNLDPRVPLAARGYEDETLWNVELGHRGSWLENRLQTNVALFHSWRRAIQIESSTQTGDGLSFRFFTDNAAAGRNYGLEADFTFFLSRNFTVFGGIGLLNAKFDDYSYVDPNNPSEIIVLDGEQQSYAPRANFHIGAEWKQTVGFFARAQLSGRTDYSFSVSERQNIGGYAITNLSAGYDTGEWRFSVWVNNVFDRNYNVRGFYFANEPPAYDAPKAWLTQGDPRQIGVTVRYEF